MAKLIAHDCFGAILKIEGERIEFICELCAKAYQVMDAEGLHNISPHSSRKHPNSTSLAALEYALGVAKKFKRAK